MKNRGFSLLELLIVVMIILIVATIAIPSLLKNRQPETIQIIREKHNMPVDWKLVSTAGWLCTVGSDDFLKAEVGKPFKCRWYK